MNKNKAFTLIELMVVILFVAIIAAVAIPIMRGRIDTAKWAEGKAMVNSLAASIRSYAEETGRHGTYGADAPSLALLDFTTSELTGTYFAFTDYSWITSYDEKADPPLKFRITVTAPTGISTPSEVTLDETGTWSETP